jgi:hypothetical protein
VVHIIVVVSLWLIVGAIATTGLTWILCVCSACNLPFMQDGYSVGEDPRLWRYGPIRNGELPWFFDYEGSWYWSRESGSIGHFHGTQYSITVTSIGVPFRSLASWTRSEFHGADPRKSPSPQITGEWSIGGVPLPLIPFWPGFALNTLFYAVLACGLYHVPRVIRRHRRARMNLCTECHYDRTGLAGDAKCPECGVAAGSVAKDQ